MATTRRGAKEGAQVGSTLLVIHNFAARSGDELALSKGDRIELIERDDDFGDGWFLGKHLGNGRTGLFPEVYTTVAPKPTLPNAVQQRGVSDSIPGTTPAASASAVPVTAQYRHSSATAASPRPVSAAAMGQSISTSPPKQPNIRTSLPPAAITSITRSDAMSTASPVMNETLSVINEHMNDMTGPGGQKQRSAAAGYSSYIRGHETDEEEGQMHTEADVMSWSSDRVAEYLEDHGVEKSHCDVFKEQDITGEVLLAMEQSSLFLKEFSLGSVGRRLKTWHKIRALQDEVRQTKSPEPPTSIAELDGGDAEAGAAARNRASTLGSALPRALDTSRQSSSGPIRSNTLQPISQPAPSATDRGDAPVQAGVASSNAFEPTWATSPQNPREMLNQLRQERRQSSLDREAAAATFGKASREIHRKQPSLDQSWKPGQPQSNGKATAHAPSSSVGAIYPSIPGRDSSLPSTPNKDDQEKEYFSPSELDSRSRTSTTGATSKTSAEQISRTSSFGNRRSTYSGSHMTSNVMRDSMSPTVSQGILGALSSDGSTFGSMRSVTSPTANRQTEGANPVVTKLDYSASTDDLARNVDESGSRSATSPKVPFLSSYKPKLTGIRTISDAITRNERQSASPAREQNSPALPGTTTPSTETQSIELEKADAQSRLASADPSQVSTSQRRIRVKPKKATSAYTRGLERKSPDEQIIGSDYSGWMKKKSGSLMTTWKPRLFILRGRRLSYYYSDNDTEEKGLIDISFHRVLPAQNETLTGLHAAMTGAASNPTSPKESQTQTAAQKDLEKSPPPRNEIDEGMFIFKLVPPKSGLSKGVNFTKPTVHYFAVNSRQEGRLWMAALMKATIDRDEDGVVTTTYNQKTISLAKARARRERPPALMDTADEKAGRAAAVSDDNAEAEIGQGLGIDGLADDGDGDVAAGADRRGIADAEDASSLAPSTVMTGLDSIPAESNAGDAVPVIAS